MVATSSLAPREPETAVPAATVRQASYVSDDKYALVRLALGVCAAGSENLSLASDWRQRIMADWLPCNFQLLAAVPRLVPLVPRGMVEGAAEQAWAEVTPDPMPEMVLAAHFGEACTARAAASPDIGVLLSVLCKVDIDSACEGRGPDAGDAGIKQMLLQRLGGGDSLPRRVATALLGRELDTTTDDGLVVTLQADDVLFLEYIYTAAAQTWLPLHCTPNDPLCLPPPPPLGGATGAGRYCALEVSLKPCVLVMPSPRPSPTTSCSGASAGASSSGASVDAAGSAGCTSAVVSVSVEEWRSPLLDMWPDELMTQEPIRLEVHLHSSSCAFSSSPATSASGGGADAAGAVAAAAAAARASGLPTAEVATQPEEEEGAAEARRLALADPNTWDPSSPSAVQLIRQRGDVVVHMPARRCRHQQHLGAPCPQPYAGLLVVEVWRGTLLCGVGHAVLVEQEDVDGRVSNSAPTPGAPCAPVTLVPWATEAATLAAAMPSTPPALTSPLAPSPSPLLPPPQPLPTRVASSGRGAGAPGVGSPVCPDSPTYGRRGSGHMRAVPLRGMALGGQSSWESASQGSTEAGSFEYATVRVPQAAAARIAQDPQSLLLQDLGLFLVYAAAHAGDSLSPSFMGLQLRSRLQVHEAMVRAGCRALDASVEAGLPALAAALHRRLRGLGCTDKQLLMGGVQRPAGLPLLHLALLSGCHAMALLALEWCNAAKGVKGLTKPVTVVLPAAEPDSGCAASTCPGVRSSLDAVVGTPVAGIVDAYETTIVDPQQLAKPLGLQDEVAQLGFHFSAFSSPHNTYRPQYR
ncbi:hypothetical protein HYH02_002860 [Chlamydomonas schloesseri]|uniref:Uncharacterized protein n=1 Tax=Chlamydomonas schloesseri TaxID=2026947 RepID=A0A835WR86_9CHLO|nr:hypothetical protein HYH02_002860 [Chlamydomonas schloesseri]|eukprot:KAG2452623.1 hypothetical protein HYH02_002860 [Chlamydomonas schloesseri]